MAVVNSSFMRSSDQGAVVGSRGRCSGTNGDLTQLVDMLLLNGYNWQQITPANLTRSSTVATLNLNNHGFNPYQRLWMTQGDTNDPIYVGDTAYTASIPTINQITFTVAASGASTGASSGSTTANGAIGSTTATSITVTSAASFPSSGRYAILIDTEWMLVTAGQGTTTWTVIRGFGNSTAATHLNSAAVTQVILIGVAPAGGYNCWISTFRSGGTKATYQASGGNQRIFEIDDSTATPRWGAVRGYSSMTASATGLDQTPTVAQMATAPAITKSSVADTSARQWSALVSNRWIYLNIDTANNGAAIWGTGEPGNFFFGDLIGLARSGDLWGTYLMAAQATPVFSVSDTTVFPLVNWGAVSTSHYVMRSFTGIGSAVNANKFPIDVRGGAAAQMYASGQGTLTFPHPPDGGIYLSPVCAAEGTAGYWRGIFPGFYFIMHTRPALHGDIWTGSGAFAGKTFVALNCYFPTTGGQIAWEISNTIQDS